MGVDMNNSQNENKVSSNTDTSYLVVVALGAIGIIVAIALFPISHLFSLITFALQQYNSIPRMMPKNVEKNHYNGL